MILIDTSLLDPWLDLLTQVRDGRGPKCERCRGSSLHKRKTAGEAYECSICFGRGYASPPDLMTLLNTGFLDMLIELDDPRAEACRPEPSEGTFGEYHFWEGHPIWKWKFSRLPAMYARGFHDNPFNFIAARMLLLFRRQCKECNGTGTVLIVYDRYKCEDCRGCGYIPISPSEV